MKYRRAVIGRRNRVVDSDDALLTCLHESDVYTLRDNTRT